MHLAQEIYFHIFAMTGCTKICFYRLEVWTLSEHCNLPKRILYPFDAWVDTKSVILFMSIEWEEKNLYYVF